MRPILRLAAGAAIVLAVGATSVPLAAAEDDCTPIDNRMASRVALSARAATTIITAPSPDVPKTTVDGSTVVSHIILTDTGTVRCRPRTSATSRSGCARPTARSSCSPTRSPARTS